MIKIYKNEGYVPSNYCSEYTRTEISIIEIPVSHVRPDWEDPMFETMWGKNRDLYYEIFASNITTEIQKITGDECIFVRNVTGTSHEYPVYKIVKNSDGFTKAQYEEVNGVKAHFPTGDHHTRIDLNAEGKVCFYPQNGDLSVFMGAPEFSSKGILCIELLKELPLRVKLIN